MDFHPNIVQYYGPDYELDVRASNMDNANSRDYLEKIKIQVIENLKKTAHAPSVQMTEIPRTTIMGGTEEDDDILDDEDEDQNKDVRTTKRQWDARVEVDGELDDASDDEEILRDEGIFRPNGTAKRRNISAEAPNSKVASDVDMDSGVPSPAAHETPAAAAITEANAEINKEIMEQKTLNATAAALGEDGPSNAPCRAESPKPTIIDKEGDVEMGGEAAPEPPNAPESIAKAVTPAVDETMTEAPEATIKEEGEAERTAIDVEGEVAKEVAEAQS